jgi:hypothetical protein
MEKADIKKGISMRAKTFLTAVTFITLFLTFGAPVVGTASAQSGDAETYTSDTFGFTVSWDSSVWEEFDTEQADTFGLTTRTTTLIFLPAEYTGETEDLFAEVTAAETMESDAIGNWEVAEDANGDPLTGSRRSIYYGVFTFTGQGADQDDPHIAYVQAQPLIEDETAIIILAVSEDRTTYNDDIEPVLDVVNGLEVEAGDIDDDETPESDGGDDGEQTPEPTPDPDDAPEIDDDLWI